MIYYQRFLGFTILTPDNVGVLLRGADEVPVVVEGATRSPGDAGFVGSGFTMGKEGNDAVERTDCLSAPLVAALGVDVEDDEVVTPIGFGGSEGWSGTSGFDCSNCRSLASIFAILSSVL
ncbi:unnamed protein product [Somion occarium]|uniref:Uncharacterized protein n=1 Tax=Somion occarium TaxID=3059160 RepID=A0ABP1D5T6_9APHY